MRRTNKRVCDVCSGTNKPKTLAQTKVRTYFYSELFCKKHMNIYFLLSAFISYGDMFFIFAKQNGIIWEKHFSFYDNTSTSRFNADKILFVLVLWYILRYGEVASYVWVYDVHYTNQIHISWTTLRYEY